MPSPNLFVRFALSCAKLAVGLLIAPIAIQAQFVAYNDHAPGPGTGPNTTTWDVFGNAPGSSGPLKNVLTGANLPVTLTITTSNTSIGAAGTQGVPAPGTPLYETFNGFVDFQGSPSPSIEITEGGAITYTFTGLNPNKRYSFKGSAVRGNETYIDRWTLFDLVGAISYTPAHTANVLTTANTQLISPSQAAVNTGVNSTATTGDMAAWNDIDPGPEGSFSVTTQQYTGPVPDGSSLGPKGYGMTGFRLEEFDFAKTPASITNQPVSLTVEESHSVAFTVGVDGNPLPAIQWFKNNAALPNETNATLTIPAAALADDNAIFKAVAANTISNIVYSVTSSNAVLRVLPDQNSPALLDAEAIGIGQVKVLFSERVDPASATNLANYTITGPSGTLTITNATLDASQTFVILEVAGMGENIPYRLNVSNVKDQSSAGNVIFPASEVAFSAITYSPQDIGAVIKPGGITAVAGGYNVSGAGADIAGARDAFQFAWQQRSGNFDLRARVADLTITDGYVKAGLMIRETLTDNSKFAAVFASSAQLGTFFQSRASAASTAVLTGPTIKFPANYPYAWLRLKRDGSLVTGFGSFDGTAWQSLGTLSSTFPDRIYFGMAVTSGNTNALATAQFRDIGAVDSPSTFAYVPAREALGPSNRRTGIIFSEVMYHPKDRADLKNLDFVEIYNSEPIFIDMTGWKITGGIEYSFPAGFKLGAGQFAVIAAEPSSIESVYNLSGVLGPFAKKLSAGGDQLTLRNTAGAVRADFTYDSKAPWPVSPDGAGHSLVCLYPSYGEEDPRAWGASQLVGGSPGFDDPIVPNPWAGVVINEFLSATAVPNAGGFIELFNASNAEVDLSGCFLTDSATTNRFKIPAATLLPARSAISFGQEALGFAPEPAGGKIYLVSADQTRVLDAVKFKALENGVSSGRSPDGHPATRRLAAVTPGQPNSAPRLDPIVINEIMYAPISRDDDDEYIELYNRSNAAVDLSGWRFTSGIDFTFPAGATIPADGYVVVAKNLSRALANYAQLKATNTFGNFSGQIKADERIALSKPGSLPTQYIVVSEVTFKNAGRWPELADRGGSSLELRDPRADLALAANWGASDETQKSAWETYEQTATLNLANQQGNAIANKFFIMGQGEGDYLFDNIEVLRAGSTNIMTNGDFETGVTGWTFAGTHRNTFVQSGGAFAGANSLRVRAADVGDEGPNSIRGLLRATLPSGSSVVIRVKARWLSGWPEILLRIRGNGVEFPVRFNIPKNLGTPGLANSRRVNNAGPAISEVTHFPPLPAANQSVVVTARISDVDGLGAPQLILRLDPGTATTTILMRDDGTAGDRLAGDGLFSATIPARPSGTVAFRIQARDNAGASAVSIFPDDAPTRECIIRWGDAAPFGSFGHYHLWSTAASEADIATRSQQDRFYRDCTVVADTRVIYNASWRNKGSPFHGGSGSYSLGFPDDDLFLGSDKHVLRSTGNGGDEATEMAGAMGYWIAEKMGLPFNNSRYVRLYRNGTLHYRIDYDLEVPDRSIAKDWFGGGGLDDTLYKIAGWFEYDDNNANGTASLQWSTIAKKPTSAPPFKTAAYRFNFQPHPGGKTANDYSLIFNLSAAATAADKVAGLMNIADMEQWMRIFAMRRVLGDWDSWSYNTGQNMYLYAPLGQRARLMPWDMDFVLGLGDGAGSSLFSAGQDSGIQALMSVPTYRRMLLRAYQDAVNGPLVKETSDAQFDARRSALLKNNISASAPTSLKIFVASARTSISSQIRTADSTTFSMATPPASTATATLALTGIAPFPIATIEVNGVPYPVTWTGNTAWRIQVPLGAATNVLQVVGKDLRGNVFTNATREVTVVYTGAVPQPADWVVINEIMYNAAATDAEFIEIYNRHPSYAFDLSGFKLKGADFTFPAGAFIQPNGYLVIAKNSASFAAAYGATIPIIGEYQGKLQNVGETLALARPGPAADQNILIDKVRYDSAYPWPATANGFGPSLQRIDAAADSWRVGNWGVTAAEDPNRATPGRANSNRSFLDPFPALWINEILANNQTGLADAQGERDPWIEIYNSGSSPLDLGLYYLSNDPSAPTPWVFPEGTMLGAGQFLTVWADGQPEQTTATEIHTSFRLAPSGLITIARIQAGAPAVVDFVYYPETPADRSYGSIADGDGDTEPRRVLFLPTPGGPNNPGNLLVPVTINEWMSSNTRTIADPADNDFDDWFELYNDSGSTVDLTGFFLSNDPANSTKFEIPPGYAIAPHGFLLVWADSEANQNLPARADLHVNFKLSKTGDTIAFFTPNGAMLDSVHFAAQNDNISAGRYPDGGAGPFTFTTPTPRAANPAPLGTTFTRITLDAGQLTIAWRATAGRAYTLEAKSDLNQPTWTPVSAPITATGPSVSTIVNVTPNANAFYRVVQSN
jgi:hypothetical protein